MNNLDEKFDLLWKDTASQCGVIFNEKSTTPNKRRFGLNESFTSFNWPSNRHFNDNSHPSNYQHWTEDKDLWPHDIKPWDMN